MKLITRQAMIELLTNDLTPETGSHEMGELLITIGHRLLTAPAKIPDDVAKNILTEFFMNGRYVADLAVQYNVPEAEIRDLVWQKNGRYQTVIEEWRRERRAFNASPIPDDLAKEILSTYFTTQHDTDVLAAHYQMPESEIQDLVWSERNRYQAIRQEWKAEQV